MSAIIILLAGIAAFIAGYAIYSRFIAKRIFELDPDFETPAHSMEDGIDYVPTNKYVLWGHHFTSIAGAAPIVGPAIAVIWGWLPAFLWVIFGTIFFAGVHDAGAIWASVRNRARSVGALSGDLVGSSARSLFMIVIFLLLLMINAVFAVLIAQLFTDFPESVFPSVAAIIVALALGQLIHRGRIGLPTLSIVGVILLYLSVYAGSVMPLELPGPIMGLSTNAQWILLLFAYAAIASILPVWVLLQPRDYINGLQLFVGLGLVYLSILIVNPTIVAPAINDAVPPGTPPLLPLLFVTIACGAISGFHGLVSSGTTSKQIRSESDIRFVGYFGSIGEGSLALATILVTTAGIASLGEWRTLYSSFGSGGLEAFVLGGGALVSQGIGLSATASATLLAVMAVLFAATTMDTGLRLQRYIVQEWGQMYHLKILTGNSSATLVSVGACLLLAFGVGGSDGSGGMTIWPLFGTTNQLLGALTFLIITLLVARKGNALIYTGLPMLFLLIVSLTALVVQMADFYKSEQWFLLGLDIIVLVAAIWVTLVTSAAISRQIKANRKAAAD
ncbi:MULTISPECIES: carbon starvation protein A [unclassified Iodidimonas]|jgi:carbon starvation protein|uniref:carbon starvation CstA family protein n=1 Tax=unclassified Iodidimonas TaxID=2626145 RepID=UPI002482ECA4|nr:MULTISPECIES: carbon starvation protein A [unclassified Iodidimonas]